MTTQSNVQTQPAWPLLPTQEAHAHLTWTEWTAQQAASLTRTSYAPSTAPAPVHRALVARLDRRAATLPTWPLPATLLPNARLSWAAWLDARSRKPSVVRQEAAEQPEETAA
jgi:hypothetical protein